MNSEQYLRIGQIVRAHGVRGAVKLLPTTDDVERFRGLGKAFLEEGDAYRPVEISGVRLLLDAVVLQIGGVDGREAADALRGRYLCVDRAHAVQLPPDTYFVVDLIGCETFDTDGAQYGRVTDVLETGYNDVYEIEHGKLMVPALKRVLSLVDTAHKRIVFDAAVLKEVGLFED